MAPRNARGGINKSAEIRRQLEETPNAGPKEIAARLGERGIEVSESLVSVVRSKFGTNGRKTVRKARRRIAAASDAPSKSQHVKDYLAEHPDAGPHQIAAALGERGIHVSVSLANKVKSDLRRGRRRRKPVARRAAVSRPAAPRQTGADRLSAHDLFEAKKLVDQLGGIAQARRALETLEQLR